MIWRSGTSISLYRGVSYLAPSVRSNKRTQNRNAISRIDNNIDYSEPGPIYDVNAPRGDSGGVLEEKKSTELLQEVKYEDEVDKLLESLGPRYTDWPGDDPLPVDADLLPGIVPGYEPPFRILPYGVRSTLSVKDATSLRRLARVVPPHFALGIHFHPFYSIFKRFIFFPSIGFLFSRGYLKSNIKSMYIQVEAGSTKDWRLP